MSASKLIKIRIVEGCIGIGRKYINREYNPDAAALKGREI